MSFAVGAALSAGLGLVSGIQKADAQRKAINRSNNITAQTMGELAKIQEQGKALKKEENRQIRASNETVMASSSFAQSDFAPLMNTFDKQTNEQMQLLDANNKLQMLQLQAGMQVQPDKFATGIGILSNSLNQYNALGGTF